MFKGRLQKPHEGTPVRGCCSLMAPLTSLRVPSPVEDFYREEVQTPLGSTPAVTYRNDIYMILNQRRLDSMTLAQFSDYLDHDRSASQLSQMREKMSDEQLHQFVKSRYIQHPSELRAWASYLDIEYSKEIQKLEEAVKKQTSKTDPSPDPAPAPAPAPAAES